MLRLLLVSPSVEETHHLRQMLRLVSDLPWQVMIATNSTAALDLLGAAPVDLVLLDERARVLDVLEPGRKRLPELPWVVLGSGLTPPSDLLALLGPLLDYLPRADLTPALLERTIRRSVGQARLLTDLRRSISNLEAQNSELEAYSHTVAHDLMSPVNVITGYAALIQHTQPYEASDEVREWGQQIQVSCERMADMIQQLLWLARTQDAHTMMHPVDPLPVITNALLRFTPQIESRDVQIDLPSRMPRALAHPALLEEIFANLISNALKYLGEDNPAPSLILRGHQLGTSVIYEVQDNGIGIATTDQQRLFQRFSRVGESQNTIQGLGLGLSIVRRLVLRLGGSVTVSSQLGQGSTFSITLPAADTAAASTA